MGFGLFNILFLRLFVTTTEKNAPSFFLRETL